MAIKTVLKIFAYALLVFILAAGLALGGIAYAYKDKYYPQVKIANLKLTGKSETEGKKLVRDKIAQYMNHPVRLTLPDIAKPRDEVTNQYPDVEIAATASQLGLIFDGETELGKAWSVGHQNNLQTWFSQALPALFSGTGLSLAYHIDQAQVQSFIRTQVTPKITNPTPAKLSVSGAEVKVEAAKPGLEVDEAELAKQLSDSLETAMDSDVTYLKVPAKIVDSTVTVPTVQPVADQLDQLGNQKITFLADKFTLVPKREEILTWFAPVQDAQGHLSLNLQKDNLAKFLQTNAKLDQSKTLTTAVKDATALLTKVPANNTVTISATLKPVEVPKEVVPGTYTPGKFEGKYIEVSLADQKMYLLNGQNLEKTYTVSTGKWSTPTPVGTYYINGKTKRAYSAAYGLYMPYWQNFLGGQYGIHELPEWPNGYKEGESHLGTPVSHGCIRLGVGSAAEVYNWTSDGTPIYIH